LSEVSEWPQCGCHEKVPIFDRKNESTKNSAALAHSAKDTRLKH
jgi:hypothetical protein